MRSCDRVAKRYTSNDVWQDVSATEGVRKDIRKNIKKNQGRSKEGTKEGARKEPRDRSSEYAGGRVALRSRRVNKRSGKCAGGRVKFRHDNQRVWVVNERGCLRSFDRAAGWDKDLSAGDTRLDARVPEGVLEKAEVTEGERRCQRSKVSGESTMELKLTKRSRRSQRTEGVQNKSGKNREGLEEGARKD